MSAVAKPSRTCLFITPGRLEYQRALALQRRIVDARWQESLNHDVLLLLEHPAVFTLGRRGGRDNLGVNFDPANIILYGLGNLFFDQMWSLGTRQEVVDRHVIYEGKHLSTELLTFMLEDFCQPRPMTADERRDLLTEVFVASGW